MRKWAKCYRQIEIVCSCFIGQHIALYEVIRKSQFNNRTVVGLDKDYKVPLLKRYHLWCCVFGLCQNAEKQHLQDIAAMLRAYQFQSNTVCL